MPDLAAPPAPRPGADEREVGVVLNAAPTFRLQRSGQSAASKAVTLIQVH